MLAALEQAIMLKDKVQIQGFYVGKRVDGMIYAENALLGREVHGIVTKVWETRNFGWWAIREDNGNLALFRF
jgi:hypothetical protein